MIIEDGAILPKIKTGGGIDPETGYPTQPSVEWGNPIPCQYSAVKHNNLGKANGEHFTIASYSILIEEQPFPYERVKLMDLKGKEVGEFSVLETEPLQAVCQIRILCH